MALAAAITPKLLTIIDDPTIEQLFPIIVTIPITVDYLTADYRSNFN